MQSDVLASVYSNLKITINKRGRKQLPCSRTRTGCQPCRLT